MQSYLQQENLHMTFGSFVDECGVPYCYQLEHSADDEWTLSRAYEDGSLILASSTGNSVEV